MGPDNITTALVDEAMKKSGLIWLRPPEGRSQAVWHVWRAGAAYVLTGPGEQPNPGLTDGGSVEVTVRSKDNWHLLVVLVAAVELRAVADDPDAADELAKTRLNLSDAEHAPSRWAKPGSGFEIYRLTPTAVTAAYGDFGDESRRAAPVASPATTRGRLPKVFHRRGHSGRRLS